MLPNPVVQKAFFCKSGRRLYHKNPETSATIILVELLWNILGLKLIISKKSLMWIIGSFIVAALAFSLSLFSDSFEPVQAFWKAKQLIEQGGISDAARPLLEMSKNDPDLAPWANLMEARVLEAQSKVDPSKLEPALKLFSEIPDSHPSSLDARMEILKLINGPIKEQVPVRYRPATMMEYMLDIERDAQGSRRKDILAELDFLRADIAEHQHEITVASDILMKLREASRGEEAAQKAKQQLFELRRKYPSDLELVSLSDRQREAKQLLKEGSFEEALSLVKEAERLTSHSAQAYVELALLEAQLLRKLEKHRDVEQLLTAIISANTPGSNKTTKDENSAPNPRLAERALMELSKHFWNKNDTDKALLYTNQLIQLNADGATTSLGSTLKAEAYYIQGRALEEASRLDEAIAAYNKVDQERPTISIKLSAKRRLAWVATRKKDYPRALDAFNQVIAIAENDLKTRNPDSSLPEGEFSLSYGQMQDELRHALYWSAEIMLKHPTSPSSTTSTSSATAADARSSDSKNRLIRIMTEAPYSYYAFLSSKLLGGEMETERAPTASASECYYPISGKTFLPHLKRLQEFNLTDFAQKEIEWYFYRRLSPALDKQKQLTSETKAQNPLTIGLSRARVYQDLGIFRPGIGAAIEVETMARRGGSWAGNRGADNSGTGYLASCENELLKRLYPMA